MLQMRRFRVAVTTEDATVHQLSCMSTDRVKALRSLAAKHPSVFQEAVHIEFKTDLGAIKHALIQRLHDTYGMRAYSEELRKAVSEEIETYLLQQAELRRDVTQLYMYRITCEGEDWQVIFPLVED